MQETMGSSSSSAPRLEDIPELIHCIQFRLPVKDAAGTSVLSKSWLHAWSTIHTLRFSQALKSLTKQENKHHLQLQELIDRTLIRYLRDNIPIKRIYLCINNDNKAWNQNLIHHLTTTKTTSLNNLSLFIVITKTSFPHEILSITNLSKINVVGRNSGLMKTSTRPVVINCVSLKKLELERVRIKEELLDDILSTCCLLEVLELSCCKGFHKVKVKNLRCLRRIMVHSYEPNLHRLTTRKRKRILEINDHLPNLTSFLSHGNTVSFNNYSFANVTQLCLGDMIMDDAYLDMITLKFPLLMTLTLSMRLWKSESFHFTCPSIKTLSLLNCINELIIVQVNAPRLTSFWFQGKTMPSLVLPAAVSNISLLEHIKVVLLLRNPVDVLFFVKMSQALALSIKCDIKITTSNNSVIQPPFDIDIGNLRKLVPSPAKNVQQLLFKTNGDDGLWEYSPFFDALFSICHPKYVVARPDKKFKHNNHFCKLMESKVLEKKNCRKDAAGEYLNWPYYLKGFEKDESLPDSFRSSLDASGGDSIFKLNWR